MDYHEIRAVVREELNKAMEERLPFETCPECKEDTFMVRIDRYPEGIGSDPVRKFLRCLGCLKLFEVKVEEVESLPKREDIKEALSV